MIEYKNKIEDYDKLNTLQKLKKISISQSGQGLLSVKLNDKRSNWKISNENGVWNLYFINRNTMKTKVINKNLAEIIHHPEKLERKVLELIIQSNQEEQNSKRGE